MVEVAKFEEAGEIPAVCDYCKEPKPEFYCAICGYNFHADCRPAHRAECASKLRGDMEFVECSVEDCWEPVLAFYRCPVCERWLCYRHVEQHIKEELNKAERKVEEG